MDAISPLTGRVPRIAAPSRGESVPAPVVRKALRYTTVAALFSAVTAHLWFGYIVPARPSLALAVFSTALALPAATFAVWKVKDTIGKADRLSPARSGRMAVDHALEELRAEGYSVFHDLPVDGLAVDHVLVGRTGIYAIEIMTPRMPSPDAEVAYDGTQVVMDGEPPDRDPVTRAKAQAGRVRDRLRNATGIQFPVRPVVLYPGRSVRQPSRGCRQEVWVLNEGCFQAFLHRERPRLPRHAMHLAISRLSCWANRGRA